MSDSLIMCPQCGQVIDVSDENTPLLTPANLTILHDLRHILRPGQQFTVLPVARRLHMSGPGLHYHLRFLVAAGLIVSWTPTGKTLRKYRMANKDE